MVAPTLKREEPTDPPEAGGVPVDRGWAWVVAAAACAIYGMHGANAKVEGMVFIEMVEHFSSDQQTTLWVFSIGGMVMLCTGPFASMLVAKTCHRTTFCIGIGSISLGIILTGYLPLMEASFFSWSVLYGFGRGCLIVTSLTCTAPYFKKYRGLAIGIATAGSGVVSFILPVVLRRLFDSLTFEGTLLIYGGIVSQLFVLAMLVRPMTYYVRRRKSSDVPDDAVAFNERKLTNACNGRCDMQQLEQAARDSLTDPWVLAKDSVHFQRQESAEGVAPDKQPVSDFSAASTLAVASTEPESATAKPSAHEHNRLLSHDRVVTGASKKAKGILELLRHGPFLLLAVALLFYANGINIVYTVMAAYGRHVGVSKETVSTLLAISGGLEVVCRGLHGWFSDRKLVPNLVHMTSCLAVTGAAAIFCPIAAGAAGIGLLSAACGVAGTSVFSLGPIVLRDIIEPESVTIGLGLQLASRGFSYILSTFVVGYLVRTTGSWDAVFYYIGVNALIAACITLGIYAWQRRRTANGIETQKLPIVRGP